MDQQLLNDIIQWDIKNWSKALKLWEPILKDKKLTKVLALGEREGGLSLYLALNNKHVTCTDYNKFEQTPLKLHKKYNVTDKITYSIENATSLNFEDNLFDIVVFKSMLGALRNNSNQEKAFQEAYRVLKPGGYLLFAENLEASSVHRYARKKFTKWGEKWHYPQLNNIIKHCNIFKSFEYKSYGFFSPFGRNEKQRVILSKLDYIFTPFTPKRWRYILFGIAKK